MVIIIVGAGKLAQELLGFFAHQGTHQVLPWAELGGALHTGAVLVHAGSGRELDAVISYCMQTQSTLVELATGTGIEQRALGFPVVLCPNTNILMLKVMAMLASHGRRFAGYARQLTESHQAGKSSTPGTAVELAEAVGLQRDDIVSVRDPAEQQGHLHIPAEHLSRHALHRLVIEDGLSSMTLETRVFGPAPYAQGLARIVDAIGAHRLENRLYKVTEFIENDWV